MSTPPSRPRSRPPRPVRREAPRAAERVEELAMLGYDALSPADIAQRLEKATFSLPDLKQIEGYEAQHRNRSTVLQAVRLALGSRSRGRGPAG